MSYFDNFKKAVESIDFLHRDFKMQIEAWNKKNLSDTGTEDFMESITELKLDESNCISFNFLNQKLILISDINAIKGTTTIHTHIVITDNTDYPKKTLHEIEGMEIGLIANRAMFKGLNLRNNKEDKKNIEPYVLLDARSSLIIEYFYKLVKFIYPTNSSNIGFSFI